MADSLDRLSAALAERYRLERELGRGGMATVYLATDLRHERSVAHAGTYLAPSGGKVEVVFQAGRGLMIPPSVDLVPWRPHQFRVKEYPDLVPTFTVEDGKVTEVRTRDPSGEYVFKRVP